MSRALGVVDWTAQRVRASWRLLRASNRYVFHAILEGARGLPDLLKARREAMEAR
jgi:hypothetical protein